MKLRTLPFVLALSSLAVLACDDDDPSGPQQFARVRLVNASSSTANASAAIGSANLGSIAFRTASANCAEVPVGNGSIAFSSGGAVVATAPQTNFLANEKYTVVLYGTGATRTAVVYRDNFSAAAAGTNLVRFINAQQTAGDVFVTTPTGAITGTPSAALAASAATTGGSAGFLSFATANSRVRLFNTGVTTGTPRADLTLENLPTSRAVSVVFVEAGTPVGATAFQVNPCT